MTSRDPFSSKLVHLGLIQLTDYADSFTAIAVTRSRLQHSSLRIRAISN
jgi:hypothetical protein